MEKPYFQSDKDCFAAGIFIRWQHNEPLLIIEILDQLFKCGEFHYLDANNAKETMHPVLRRSESSTSQLVVSSLAAIFEKKRPQQAGNYHASDTAELLFFNIAKVEEELKKDPIIRKHLESYYVRQKVASLKEGLSQTYEEHQCYAEHRVAGLFCLNIPVNAFFKLGGVPNPVRKAILRSLKGLPAHLELGRDILVEGHSEGMVKVMFNKDALQPVLEEIDPGKFLEKFLELKKQQGYMPGMLIPLLCSFALESINHSVSHVANAVIPKIDSLDDVKEGEGIPAVWTNWADPSQILIFKRNGKFEWLDSNGEHVNMCEMRLFDPEKNKFTPAE
ncbi:MAG: hypothetical protein LBI34_01820 [Puniceicoccales bacterium]|nr:hypothetical protein [Puniceicoccales bacterium]